MPMNYEEVFDVTGVNVAADLLHVVIGCNTGWCIKKWTISFCCLQRVYHTHTKNFYNIYSA